MEFKIIVKGIIVFIQVILALVVLIILTAFAISPSEVLLFTNALLLIMIMVELYTVNVLIDLHEKLEVRKK